MCLWLNGRVIGLNQNLKADETNRFIVSPILATSFTRPSLTVPNKIMKTKNRLVLLSGALMLALSASAQTTAVDTHVAAAMASTSTPSIEQDVQGVGTTIGGWFTSENPANRFQDVQTWAGAVNQNNAPVANEVGGSYDIWRQHSDYYPYTAATNQSDSSIYIAAEGRIRDAQIGVMSIGVGPQIGWMQNDVRIGVFAEPVYRFDKKNSHYRAEFGIAAEKMLTANTAVGLLLSIQTHETVPFIGGDFSVSFGNGKGLFGLF
jgi:hypothetical protein